MQTANSPIIDMLLKLQLKDSAIDALRRQSAEIPEQITEVQDEFNAIKEETRLKQENYKKHLLRKKELEASLAEKEALIKKHERELNEVKTNDAYKALQNEIAAAKKESDSIETEILSCMDEIDSASKQEKDLVSGLKKEEENSQLKIKTLEAQKAGLDSKISSLEEERQTFVSAIAPDALKRYDKLRSQRNGTALSEAKKQGNNFICSQCNMLLRPQDVVNLTKKDQFVPCESCQRILYLKETADAS